MKVVGAEQKEGRIVLRCEPSFIERADRVADARYAGNRSYMVRLAVNELLTREEQKIAEADEPLESRAA